MNSSTLPPLIQQMLSPTFYPHPVREPIQLIQTHISFVLLTGEYTYKIKKSVDFGFLDFSTLDKRKHFCEEELRLNRQNAPGIYLNVLPIVQDGDRFRFSTGTGNENIVEYAVQMKEFPQSSLLINMYEEGNLTDELMMLLGKEVAAIHKKAVRNEYIDTFGKAEQIRKSIEANYAQTAKYIGIPQTREQYEETKRFTDDFFANNDEVFKRRVRNNHIRECHGDLHLKNIAYIDNKMIIFDCIEFKEDFRFVDTMYDVAFTVMDLHSKGEYRLANIFLNTYLEQSGDWEGLLILPLYLIRQAYVRGKVNSLMLDDPSVSDDEKKKIIPVAASYFKLALSYTQPRKGKIILTSGLSGSGKSTVAKLISQKKDATYIRSDAVRKHLGSIELNERGDDSLYSAEMTRKTYNRMLELGVMLAQKGYTIVLDAKYDKKKSRGEVIQTAQDHNIDISILHCTAPVDILRNRLKSRSGDITDATEQLLESQITGFEAFSDDEKRYVVEVDTTRDIKVQIGSL